MMDRTLLFLIIGLSCLFVNSSYAQSPPTVSGDRWICEGTSTTLTAMGESGASFAWYDAPSGGNLLSSNAIFSTPNLNANTHYYVSQTINGNTSPRKDVQVLVTPTPDAEIPQNVMASPATICQNSSTDLLATVDGQANQVVNWYDASSGGNLLGTSDSGQPFTVSPLSTTTYYAQSQVEIITVSYNFTSGVQVFTVPEGVTSIEVDAYGARGGHSSEYFATDKKGGKGGQVQATMDVSPGEVLNIYVGGRGTGAPGCFPCPAHIPGWNGGGAISTTNPDIFAGAGGGATDIRRGGMALTDRVLVAGGGGGATYYAHGGVGGGLIAGDGEFYLSNGSKGGGGTHTTGGSKGCHFGSCSSEGIFGLGGNGTHSGGRYGGGGGGGWYGGGGGIDDSGGGGGSSYTDPTGFQNVVHTQGVQNGHGQLIIRYLKGPECNANTNRVLVTVQVNPTPVVDAGAGVITCAGTSVTLTASGADTYVWQPGNLTGASVVVNPTETTTYTVTGTLNNGGCIDTDEVTVTVTSVTASPDKAICAGKSTVISASGADSYTWQPGNLSGASVTVSPATTTTYTVTGSNNSGCSTTDEVTITVNPLPNTNAGPDVSVKAGNPVTLTATGADTYSWSPMPSTNASLTFTPAATATYTVRGTFTATGCIADDQVVVTVEPIPVVSGNTTICTESTTTLTASGDGPFNWYNTATGGSPLYSGATFTTPSLTNNTTYWVAGSSSGRTPIHITVVDPTPTNLTAVPATVCPGDVSLLAASLPNGTINWYDAPSGGNLIGSTEHGNSLPVSPAQTTTYYAQGIISAVSDTFLFTQNVQSFTVPEGVNSITVDAYGARGGHWSEHFSSGQKAGNGGRVQATMNVSPGEILNIYVGGRGRGRPGCFPCPAPGPGWNGGGGMSFDDPDLAMGTGGGATDIRRGGTALTDRVLVAGGGGGGTYDANGGAGGGLVGGSGQQSYQNGTQGGGGTQTEGGTKGCGNFSCNGRAGTFGNGGISIFGTSGFGGAGGGGWFGGGSGHSDAGGGGGNSYSNPAICPNVVHTAGQRNGHGMLIISYLIDCNSSSRVPVVVTVGDGELPAITCPSSDIVLNSDPGQCSAIVTYTPPEGTDNCGNATTALTGGLGNGAAFPVGTTTEIYTVTDAAGNTATCSFTITVNDTEDPVISCPGIVTISTDVGLCSSTASVGLATAADNCGATVSGPIPAGPYPVGSTTVTWTATDDAGNTATCTQVVLVEDNEPPATVCAGGPLFLNLDNFGNGSIGVDAVNNGSTDACGIAGMSVVPSSFSCAEVGSNTLILTVTDVNGNTSTCTASLTVWDLVAPTALCQDITLQLDGAGNSVLLSNEINNGSSDICGIGSLSLSKTSFDCSDVGGNSVTLTLTDNNTNTSTCSATVTVQDNVGPNALCQNTTVQLGDNGQGSLSAAAVDNNSSDACGIASISVNPDQFDCNDLGPNTVTLTITDLNGNQSTCSSTTTVEDNVGPVLTCQDVTVQLDATGNGIVTAADIISNLVEACGIVSQTVTPSSFDCNDVGLNSVILVVSDGTTTTTCTRTATVEDNVPPDAQCQDVTVQLDANGQGSLLASQMDNHSMDACGIANTSINKTSFNCTDLGQQILTLTVEDNYSNTSTCTALVLIEDLTKPDISCPADFMISMDPGTCEATVTLSIPPTSDNCLVADLDYHYRPVDAQGNNIPGQDWSSWIPSTNPVVVFSFGHWKVQWRVKDTSGNQRKCAFIIEVKDEELPTLVCLHPTIVFNGEAEILLQPSQVWDESASSDNCGELFLTGFTPSEVTCNQLGSMIPVTVTIADGSGNHAACTANVTVNGLPCGWSINPNSIACPGAEAEYDPIGSSFSLTSEGCYNPNYYRQSDTHGFIQTELCGDGEISVHVAEVNGNGWAGITMRESNDPGAKMIQLLSDGNSLTRREVRQSTGTAAFVHTFQSQGKNWLKLTRFGNQFSASHSADGINWSTVFVTNISMSNCIQVGLITMNGEQTGVVTGVFEQVNLSGGNASLIAPSEVGVIQDIGINPDFQIYPNPVDAEVTVNLRAFLGREVHLIIYDLFGKVVKTLKNDEQLNFTEQLDLSDLPTGTYLLTIRSGKYQLAKKLIKSTL